MVNAADNLVNDGLDPKSCQANEAKFTYNQGVILGGLCDLYAAKRDYIDLAIAENIADSTINPASPFVDENGVLREFLVTSDTGADSPLFKGIFMRNLAYLFRVKPKTSYKAFILKNALSIVENDRTPSNQFGMNWSGPVGTTDSSRQSSGLDALNAAMRMVGVI
jgi:predicted alpha-1,6-mannanase (GH76 family)